MNNSGRDTVIFTACSVNYLPKALAMCRSVLDHDPDRDVAILIVDRKRPLMVDDERVTLIWAEDTGFPNYLQCAFKYNIIELNTALKPHVAAMLLSRYDRVIYLDPDVYVFTSLQPLIAELDRYDVLLSPHALAPYSDENRPNDVDLLRFGAYNLGFFAVRATPAAKSLLDWWDVRCQESCWYEPSLGLGVDQKWMDLAPSFFEGVGIIKHPGVNVAFWNLHERRITKGDGGEWTVNGTAPLIFVHFSSFDADDATAIAGKQTRFLPGSRPDFSMARDVYAARAMDCEQAIKAESREYGYNGMSDGKKISPTLRRFYGARLKDVFSHIADPFEKDGPVYQMAKKYKLFSKADRPEKHIDFKAENSFGKEKSLIDFAFRNILIVLGPDRYFMLMRYLNHYTSILNQKNIIK